MSGVQEAVWPCWDFWPTMKGKARQGRAERECFANFGPCSNSRNFHPMTEAAFRHAFSTHLGS